MQKIRKILRAVSEKTALPTNQPTNQTTNQPIIINNTDFIAPDWRRSKRKIDQLFALWKMFLYHEDNVNQ